MQKLVSLKLLESYLNVFGNIFSHQTGRRWKKGSKLPITSKHTILPFSCLKKRVISTGKWSHAQLLHYLVWCIWLTSNYCSKVKVWITSKYITLSLSGQLHMGLHSEKVQVATQADSNIEINIPSWITRHKLALKVTLCKIRVLKWFPSHNDPLWTPIC